MSKTATKDGKRLALTAKVGAMLEAEVKRIKEMGAYYKVNEAGLANALLEIFCTKYLVKSQSEIEARFFDKKSYLKKLIEKSASEDDLSETLNEFLNKNKVKKLKATQTAVNSTGDEIV